MAARCVATPMCMFPPNVVGQLFKFMFTFIDVCRSQIAHVILTPAVQSEWSVVQTERKLDDDYEPGECFK